MRGCLEGQDWEHKAVSSESKAWAVLLSLLLDHPVGVAAERSHPWPQRVSLGQIKQGQG